MEGLRSFYEHLTDMRSQTEKLIDARLGLNALFAEEGTRLQREDEASSLGAIYSTIAKRLKELKAVEDSARCDDSRTNAMSYLAGLVGEAIASKGNRASAVQDYLVRKRAESKRPFGLVMVRIGPRGLPVDAEAVSISRLARDSNRSEPEIVNGLPGEGYLLFTEEAFSLLVDGIVVGIREGKLHLPLSRDRLAQIMGLNRPKSSIKIVPME
jgi:hypothetical protein